MAGQYNYPVVGNPAPQYRESQPQFQPGVRLSQQQQGPVSAPSQPAMIVAAPSAPLIVQQPPPLEPRFNPCLCFNVISAPGISLRRGATFAGVAHLIHGFVAVFFFIMRVKYRYDIRYGDGARSRDHDRIYLRLRAHPAYTAWLMTNIVGFFFPCSVILLIAAARMKKLLAQTYVIWNISGLISYILSVIWNISGLISYILSVIVESVIVHDLPKKVYFENAENAMARYRTRQTIQATTIVVLWAYLLTVGASLAHYLRDLERQQGAVVMGPPAGAPLVAQMTNNAYASGSDNEPADGDAAG